MKNKIAVSLIVLVITILVMAILATTVVITLSNTNIISKANEAVKKTEAQQVEEVKALMLANGMLGESPTSQKVGNVILTWNNTLKKVDATVEGVLIPDGFSYVEGTKNTGIVIEDKENNQFVWVPVEYTETGTKNENGLDTGFTAVFKRGSAQETENGIYKMSGEIDAKYTEPFADGYATEQAEYIKMMQAVEKYHGFYIARFEAGDGDVTAARTGVTVAHKVVSKKNAYVYNYVPWGKAMNDTSPFTRDDVENVAGAVELSKNMYKESASVVSTLCYGVQWDAIMNFVSDGTHDIVNSVSWGNYTISTDADKASTQLCGSNETWKAKNIYDLAGNVWEVTMESSSVLGRTIRGGGHNDVGNTAISHHSVIVEMPLVEMKMLVLDRHYI